MHLAMLRIAAAMLRTAGVPQRAGPGLAWRPQAAAQAAAAAAAAAPLPGMHAAAAARSPQPQQPGRQHVRCFAAPAAVGQSAPKAALMVIGDEVLTGSISDANTPWLAKLLHSRGVDLVRVEMIPDDKRDIVETVLRLRERVGDGGFVFTSGGIGPTHDDITYESIAAAFGCHLELHQPTVERMQEHYEKRGVELNEARLRMARLPKDDSVEVLFTPGLWVPLVCIQQTYILPGIPRLFQSMVEAHADRFRGPAAFSSTLFTNLGEGDLAAKLSGIAALHPAVRIGSYPNVDMGLGESGKGRPYKVKLQFEGRDKAALEKAVDAVREQLDVFTLPA